MILRIVSVGPGDPALLNAATENTLRSAGTLVLRTGNHPLSAWLDQNHIPFRTMDSVYESADDFESLSDEVAANLWNIASENGDTVYAVSDTMTDHTVDAVFSCRPDHGTIRMVPGFSFADYYLPACRIYFPTSDVRICPASSFIGSGYDPSRPLLITELNDSLTAGEVKNYLSEFVRDEESVVFFEKDASARPVPLFELDRQPFYNHLSAVAAGPFSYEQRSRKTLNDLISIMDRLRGQGGCPWDRVQTHESLRPYVVEEAWEVVDAVSKNDPDHLAEELGDLLFQVVFHESIGRSFDEFTMDDILEAICGKMIRRHPHVFTGDGSENHPAEFSEEAWDRIKQAESGRKSPSEALNDISYALPSIRYAEKVLRKLEQIPAVYNPPFSETVASIRQEADIISNISGKKEAAGHIGKLLFLCALLSRKTDSDGEILLHEAVNRVIQSYKDLEKDGFVASDAQKPLTFNDLGL